ncbi:MAG: hypothetical protein JNM36_11565 [Chitinophagales bacterium]|nr:hypothetical protein [Chitinophagales bacterium]
MKSYFLWLCNAVLLLMILFLYQKGYYTTYRSDRVKQAYELDFHLLNNFAFNTLDRNNMTNMALGAYANDKIATMRADSCYQIAKTLSSQSNKLFGNRYDLFELLKQNNDEHKSTIQKLVTEIDTIIQQQVQSQVVTQGFCDTLLQNFRYALEADTIVANTLMLQSMADYELILEKKISSLYEIASAEKIVFNHYTAHTILNKERFKVGDTLRAKIAVITTAPQTPVEVLINNQKIPMQSNGIVKYQKVCKKAGNFSTSGELRLQKGKLNATLFTFTHHYNVQTICH